MEPPLVSAVNLTVKILAVAAVVVFTLVIVALIVALVLGVAHNLISMGWGGVALAFGIPSIIGLVASLAANAPLAEVFIVAGSCGVGGLLIGSWIESQA